MDGNGFLLKYLWSLKLVTTYCTKLAQKPLFY